MKNYLIHLLYRLIARIDAKKAYPLLAECDTCRILLPKGIMGESGGRVECYKCYKGRHG